MEFFLRPTIEIGGVLGAPVAQPLTGSSGPANRNSYFTDPLMGNRGLSIQTALPTVNGSFPGPQLYADALQTSPSLKSGTAIVADSVTTNGMFLRPTVNASQIPNPKTDQGHTFVKTTPEQSKMIVAAQREYRSSFASEQEYKNAFYKTYPGARANLLAEYPSGEQHQVEAIVDNNRNIKVTVIDLKRNTTIYAAYLQKKGDGWLSESWQGSFAFPESTSLDSLAIGGVFAAFLSRNYEFRNAKASAPPNSAQTQNTEWLCMDHDMVCTEFFSRKSTWPWTGDKGHLRLWFPCLNSIDIDVLKCCEGHDACLWCSNTRWAAITTCGQNVVNCMIDALWGQVMTAFGQMPWYRKIFCIGPILAVTSLYTVIGGLLGNIGEDLVAWWSSSDYVGKGYKEGSCLCGGTKPTVLCNEGEDPCRDLCAEAGLGALEDCYHCSWQCKPDPLTGKMTTVMQMDPDGKKACCPGTGDTIGYKGPCSPKPDPSTCPTCYECWKCRPDAKGVNRFGWSDREAKKASLKCCPSKYDPLKGDDLSHIVYCP